MPKLGLTPEEIRAAFADVGDGKVFTPVLDVPLVAKLFHVRPKAIYGWLDKGRFTKCARKRGKHWFFFRDRLIKTIFDGPDWSKQDEGRKHAHTRR